MTKVPAEMMREFVRSQNFTSTLKVGELDKLGDIKYKTKWYPNGATTQGSASILSRQPKPMYSPSLCPWALSSTKSIL